MLTLVLHKRHERGAATYLNPNTRARVIFSRKMFAGEPPTSVEVEVANLAEPTEADTARIKKLSERDATKVQKAVDLKAKHAKAVAKAEKLAAKLVAQEAREAARSGQSESSGQEANA